MLKPLGSRILITERFILRPFKIQDCEMMYYFYLSDPIVCKYLEFNNYQNIQDVYNTLVMYINNYRDLFYFHWAIEEKTTGNVIGSVSIHNLNFNNLTGELGICLSRYYWKRGIGKEVLSKVMMYGFNEIGIKQFQAYYLEGNEASKALLKALGLKDNPKLTKRIKKKGAYYTAYCLSS